MERRVTKRSLHEQIRSRDSILVMPGVYDALSARVAEHIGFDAIFQTGYGSAAALLGMPDFGFLNAGETVDNARRIIRAVNLPVIVDADTGYGSPLSVWRLVRDLEDLGAAGIFLEDQVWPKRCGHMQGKSVIPTNDYLLKLKAATEARKTRDFIIVARTDARASEGLDEAIDRGKTYFNAGADAVFIEAPTSVEELSKVADEVDAPLVANMIEEGVTPTLNAMQLFDMGYRIALFPLSALFAATFAIKNVLSELKQTGSTQNGRKQMVTFGEFNNLVDLQRYMELEKRYA
ncbi:isocitrate lyase/PEP mutase family protein [Nitrososphaera sp. AFS]|uniref:isocitrate lyase/PEP mutase family protein n=1 Tax=Nitrososphaera sp. AFS TaxID=2301191 RepID=UPI00139226B4|nr:oxaloacetate decarboxylase [Nitrososphaera sp. AFS]NAL78450.1 oxaloacetate decarboxylase [Nitrososphaera sp. AFS]